MTTLIDPRKTFGEALLEVAEISEKVVALSADSSAGSGVGPFKEKFPQRHFEFGIMEQAVIGFASGLATAGQIPFIKALATFLTARPFEMFKNDLGYMRQNVKVVGRCAGFAHAALGPTHCALEDVAIMRTIPGLTVIAPGDPIEIRKAVYAAYEHVGPVYIRFGNLKIPVLHKEDYTFKLGKGEIMKDGHEMTIISSGTALLKAYEAAELLEKEGINARLINIHTIKPIDKEIIIKAAKETGRIVTVEEHYLTGGLGSVIAECLAIECPTPMRMIGVSDNFAINGSYDEVLRYYGMQPEQIANTVKEFIH
jgi:transketolase